MTSHCIACGMPMEDAEDYALGDPSKSYCRYCARPDGSMQSYDEKLANYSKWMTEMQGLDPGVAIEQTRTILSQFPAWRDRKV